MVPRIPTLPPVLAVMGQREKVTTVATGTAHRLAAVAVVAAKALWAGPLHTAAPEMAVPQEPTLSPATQSLLRVVAEAVLTGQ